MDTEKMGALIAKMRKEKGLTQKELADQLHVTDRAVSKWERGICCPDISLLEDLANILGGFYLFLAKWRRGSRKCN